MTWTPRTQDFLNARGRPLAAVRAWARERGHVGTEGGWIRVFRIEDDGRVATDRPPIRNVTQGWFNYVDRYREQLLAEPGIVQAARDYRVRVLREGIQRHAPNYGPEEPEFLRRFRAELDEVLAHGVC